MTSGKIFDELVGILHEPIYSLFVTSEGFSESFGNMGLCENFPPTEWAIHEMRAHTERERWDGKEMGYMGPYSSPGVLTYLRV